LSASIDPNKIRATYNLGVLTITLPKAATAKPIKNTITEPSSSKHVGTNATSPLNKVTFMAH
jgi:hypothetical protein